MNLKLLKKIKMISIKIIIKIYKKFKKILNTFKNNLIKKIKNFQII